MAAAATATTAMISLRRPSMWEPSWTARACRQCVRAMSGSPILASGHNRWSKIRHEKGAADIKKNQMRSAFSKTLTLYSQLYGADVGSNSQLAATIAAAKKAGVPKATIEGAIARGQGRSATGAKLESMTYEIMAPPSIALIVEIEAESKAHVTHELNSMVRRRGGTATPTKFLFTRRGRVVLGADPSTATSESASSSSDTTSSPALHVSVDDILEDAIEAGAEDVDTDEDGNIVVWTSPNQTAAIVNSVAPKFKLSTVSAETIWDANEDTMAQAGTDVELRRLAELVSSIRALPEVRAIYSNITPAEELDDTWTQLIQDLDV